MKKQKMACGIRGIIFAATALSLAQGALGLDAAEDGAAAAAAAEGGAAEDAAAAAEIGAEVAENAAAAAEDGAEVAEDAAAAKKVDEQKSLIRELLEPEMWTKNLNRQREFPAQENQLMKLRPIIERRLSTLPDEHTSLSPNGLPVTAQKPANIPGSGAVAPWKDAEIQKKAANWANDRLGKTLKPELVSTKNGKKVLRTTWRDEHLYNDPRFNDEAHPAYFYLPDPETMSVFHGESLQPSLDRAYWYPGIPSDDLSGGTHNEEIAIPLEHNNGKPHNSVMPCFVVEYGVKSILEYNADRNKKPLNFADDWNTEAVTNIRNLFSPPAPAAGEAAPLYKLGNVIYDKNLAEGVTTQILGAEIHAKAKRKSLFAQSTTFVDQSAAAGEGSSATQRNPNEMTAIITNFITRLVENRDDIVDTDGKPKLVKLAPDAEARKLDASYYTAGGDRNIKGFGALVSSAEVAYLKDPPTPMNADNDEKYEEYMKSFTLVPQVSRIFEVVAHAGTESPNSTPVCTREELVKQMEGIPATGSLFAQYDADTGFGKDDATVIGAHATSPEIISLILRDGFIVPSDAPAAGDGNWETEKANAQKAEKEKAAGEFDVTQFMTLGRRQLYITTKWSKSDHYVRAIDPAKQVMKDIVKTGAANFASSKPNDPKRTAVRDFYMGVKRALDAVGEPETDGGGNTVESEVVRFAADQPVEPVVTLEAYAGTPLTKEETNQLALLENEHKEKKKKLESASEPMNEDTKTKADQDLAALKTQIQPLKERKESSDKYQTLRRFQYQTATKLLRLPRFTFVVQAKIPQFFTLIAGVNDLHNAKVPMTTWLEAYKTWWKAKVIELEGKTTEGEGPKSQSPGTGSTAAVTFACQGVGCSSPRSQLQVDEPSIAELSSNRTIRARDFAYHDGDEDITDSPSDEGQFRVRSRGDPDADFLADPDAPVDNMQESVILI
ncbi:unnamed protein product [Amoebophrya sp. A25]|nr:unnamed protein product [Amoebophrya sp. A25]|eukprot:GSA25T00012836001.1